MYLVAHSHKVVVCDTETNGLGKSAEIIQITIATLDKRILFHSLVKPSVKIDETSDSFKINGITNAMLKDAPSFSEIAVTVFGLMMGKIVVAFNAAFDSRMVVQTTAIHKVLESPVDGITWSCASEEYRKWKRKAKLVDACAEMGVTLNAAHTSLGDVEGLCDLVKAMAI
jgi:DNA polymerase III epsilon subunit-like protein